MLVKHNSFVKSIVVISMMLAFCSLRAMQQSIKSDQVLYKSHNTLQQKCLIVLAKQKAATNTLPKNLADGLEILKILHSAPVGLITPENIKSAFDICASDEIKKKVELLNTKKTKKLDELTSVDTPEAHESVPEELNLFDSLAWILKQCNNNINSGLIQLCRYKVCSERETLYDILLSLGANINHYGTADRRIRETTPLVTSAVYKQVGIMRKLLEGGANPNQKEEHGDSPYTLIKGWQTPNQEMLTLLQQYGAVDTPPCKNNHAPSEKCSLCTLQ
jgi:hypothetical protein